MLHPLYKYLIVYLKIVNWLLLNASFFQRWSHLLRMLVYAPVADPEWAAAQLNALLDEVSSHLPPVHRVALKLAVN